jgi:hypothetical protein
MLVILKNLGQRTRPVVTTYLYNPRTLHTPTRCNPRAGLRTQVVVVVEAMEI